MFTRREFIKMGGTAAIAYYVQSRTGLLRGVFAEQGPAAAGLSDPARQPKFVNLVPNALDPGFKFNSPNRKFKIAVGQTTQMTGLVGTDGTPVPTTVWGYGENGRGYTWPGRTFEVQSGVPIEVMWQNELVGRGGYLPHLVPVDTSLHWCYSLHGYEQYTIENAGVPIVTHLHGGHTDFPYDGNPEFFFNPGWRVRGPQWVDKKYIYDNSQPAGNLWYHDHALGITRLNVYAGLAGFYFIRNDEDTGKPDNPLELPAYPYELAYAIQDRMFYDDGSLFYPAFPGDPFYEDFITNEGAELPEEIFPNGGPTALAEFFGDHVVVNGMIWPKEDVEPRHYRMRLLNGTDSRFMVLQFRTVDAGATEWTQESSPLPFWVIGSDQGLASSAKEVDTLVFEPGSRYDIVFDFSALAGKRIIMTNLGGDEPFGGDIPGPRLFAFTDRIMAFDVNRPLDSSVSDDFDPTAIEHYRGNQNVDPNVRKVALFEGLDQFGRLQPVLGVAEPTMDAAGNLVNGALPWFAPTTENPALDSTEVWEIYNATEDAHPIHLHLVNFEFLDRYEFTADVVEQPLLQHDGSYGTGFRLENINMGAEVSAGPEYVENAPKDMVTALPDQVTRIKATFDKPGRYVWHCHILSHEDHEMMRVLYVGPGA